jgi:hypothetical protein
MRTFQNGIPSCDVHLLARPYLPRTSSVCARMEVAALAHTQLSSSQQHAAHLGSMRMLCTCYTRPRSRCRRWSRTASLMDAEELRARCRRQSRQRRSCMTPSSSTACAASCCGASLKHSSRARQATHRTWVERLCRQRTCTGGRWLRAMARSCLLRASSACSRPAIRPWTPRSWAPSPRHQRPPQHLGPPPGPRWPPQCTMDTMPCRWPLACLRSVPCPHRGHTCPRITVCHLTWWQARRPASLTCL